MRYVNHQKELNNKIKEFLINHDDVYVYVLCYYRANTTNYELFSSFEDLKKREYMLDAVVSSRVRYSKKDTVFDS